MNHACRRRRGYSAFRVGVRHDADDIERLYRFANDRNSPHQRLAREKLHRWGFNYKRRCCLVEADKLLVRLPGVNEVFPGVDYRDRMHGMIIFLHRVLCTLLDELVTNSDHRRTLDRRLSVVCSRQFRNEGVLVPTQKTVFGETNMTAKDRTATIFLLSHIVGPAPDDIIPARFYMPLATAIATAQLIVIAARGRRSYSLPELTEIFDKGYVLLFGSLESVREELYKKNCRNGREAPGLLLRNGSSPLAEQSRVLQLLLRTLTTPTMRAL